MDLSTRRSSPSIVFLVNLLLLLLLTAGSSHAFIPTPSSSTTRTRTRKKSPPSSRLNNQHATATTTATTDVDSASRILSPGEILPMAWDGQVLSKNAFRLGLPAELVEGLLDYADTMGITSFYRGLVIDNQPYHPGQQGTVRFGGDGNQQQQQQNWLVQRPKSHWRSNMHWTSPADEAAHDDYLRVLSAGGFDQVLDKIGTYFGLEALSAYHLSFIGVSQCEKGFIHADVNGSGRKAFNIIIPLMLESDAAAPELEILSDDETRTRYYKYKLNAASMVGDDALHATAPCDYIARKSMRLAATVYVGDITTDNVKELLMSLTQAYPPPGDAKHLLDRAGSHWNKWDSSKRLPIPITT